MCVTVKTDFLTYLRHYSCILDLYLYLVANQCSGFDNVIFLSVPVIVRGSVVTAELSCCCVTALSSAVDVVRQGAAGKETAFYRNHMSNVE